MRIVLLIAVSFGLAAVPARPSFAGDDKKGIPPKADKPEPFPVCQTIKTEADFATAISFSPDGKVLAVADGSQVRFWNPHTGKSAAEPWKFDDIPLIAFVNADTIAVYVETVRAISLRAYPSGKEVASLALGKEDAVRTLVATERFIAHDGGAFVRVWSGPQWRNSWRADWDPNDMPTALTISPDRSEVAVCGRSATLRVYAAKDGKLLRSGGTDKLVSPTVSALAYSPDGREIALSPVTNDHPLTRNETGWGLALLAADLSKHRYILRWRPPSRDPYSCAFSPDGKTLLVPTGGATVRLYETETGKLRHVGGVASEPRRFALSPDGRLFALAGGGRDVSVVDWRAAKSGIAPPNAAAWDALWTDLGSLDSDKGFQAVVAMGADQSRGAKLIGDKLKPIPTPNAESVKGWIADLGAEVFAAREAAEKELAKLGDAVEPELRAAAKSENAERRAASVRLLKGATKPDAPDRLRALRAVEVLEYLGTPAAREVLQALADGAPGATLTRDAKAARARLTEPQK